MSNGRAVFWGLASACIRWAALQRGASPSWNPGGGLHLKQDYPP